MNAVDSEAVHVSRRQLDTRFNVSTVRLQRRPDTPRNGNVFVAAVAIVSLLRPIVTMAGTKAGRVHRAGGVGVTSPLINSTPSLI